MTTSTAIDMLTPVETRDRLDVDEVDLIELVNEGRLAAYRLGGHLRFRACDVAALDRAIVAA